MRKGAKETCSFETSVRWLELVFGVLLADVKEWKKAPLQEHNITLHEKSWQGSSSAWWWFCVWWCGVNDDDDHDGDGSELLSQVQVCKN